jgi:hypothetical protein
MVGGGEKLGGHPRIGQPTCWGLGREPYFSGGMTLSNAVDNYAKGCHTWTVRDTYGQVPYADRSWDTYDVLIKFPL